MPAISPFKTNAPLQLAHCHASRASTNYALSVRPLQCRLARAQSPQRRIGASKKTCAGCIASGLLPDARFCIPASPLRATALNAPDAAPTFISRQAISSVRKTRHPRQARSAATRLRTHMCVFASRG